MRDATWLVLAVWLAGCQHGGRLLVVVESDVALREVVVEASGQTTDEHTFLSDAGPELERTPLRMPFSFAIEPSSPSLPVDVVVRGYGCDRRTSDCSAIERHERAVVSPNETRVLRILLSNACAGAMCGPGRTCGPSGCENVPTWLPGALPLIPTGGEFEAGRPDAGPIDAPGMDTPELDAPEPDAPEPIDAPEEPDAPVDAPTTGYVRLGVLSEPSIPADGAYGVAVALSAGGEIALVGAPGDGTGSVWAYRRMGASYVRIAGPLRPTEPGTRFFGSQLAIGGSGPWRALATCPATNRVYPITCDTTSCSVAARIERSDGLPFGMAVDVDSTGTHALVGGTGAVVGDSGYVFELGWSGSEWVEGGMSLGESSFGAQVAAGTSGGLVGGPSVDDLGRSLRITLLTAQAFDTNDTVDHAVLATPTGPVFFAHTTSWLVEEYDGVSMIGYVSAAISGAGDRALLGELDLGETRAGTVLVAARSGSRWTDEHVLSDGAPIERFGLAVALSADGHSALVGAPGGRGRVYAYHLP